MQLLGNSPHAVAREHPPVAREHPPVAREQPPVAREHPTVARARVPVCPILAMPVLCMCTFFTCYAHCVHAVRVSYVNCTQSHVLRYACERAHPHMVVSIMKRVWCH